MSVKTNPRRQATLTARRLPCTLGGRLHNRRNGVCVDCTSTRAQVTR